MGEKWQKHEELMDRGFARQKTLNLSIFQGLGKTQQEEEESKDSLILSTMTQNLAEPDRFVSVLALSASRLSGVQASGLLDQCIRTGSEHGSRAGLQVSGNPRRRPPTNPRRHHLGSFPRLQMIL